MSRLVRFDWAIKYLLRNKANFDVLEGFLFELLKTPIQIETILESESNKNHGADKSNRVDLLVKTTGGERIIIELQCSVQWDYLSRILYGTAKVICEYLKKGESYRHIVKVISVSIVFFELGEGRDYLYRGTTAFKGLHYGDTLAFNPKEREIYEALHAVECQTPEKIFPEYYIIKITQFQERVKEKVDEWIYFLKHGEIKEEFTAKGIQSAAQKLDVLRLSEEERRIYERYEESLHDEASFNEMMAHETKKARTEGREEGREEGIITGELSGDMKACIRIAKSLKGAGWSNQEIANHTGLSLDEIKKL